MQTDKLAGRNGDVWREYCSGRNQTYVAEKFGISQQRVSQIVGEVRSALSEEERGDWRVRALETLSEMHAVLVHLASSPAPPTFSSGDILRDENGEPVRDYSGIYSAMHLIVKLQERMARALGTDSPVRVESVGDLKVTVEGVDLDQLT